MLFLCRCVFLGFYKYNWYQSRFGLGVRAFFLNDRFCRFGIYDGDGFLTDPWFFQWQVLLTLFICDNEIRLVKVVDKIWQWSFLCFWRTTIYFYVDCDGSRSKFYSKFLTALLFQNIVFLYWEIFIFYDNLLLTEEVIFLNSFWFEKVREKGLRFDLLLEMN